MRTLLVTWAMLLVAMPVPLSAQVPAGWNGFTRAFQSYVEADKVVGASTLFMRNGRVLARYHTGLADRDRPVNEGTIFHWGSITKTLTAIAIMQLRDRGRLSLDDPVVRYVPELRRVHDAYHAIDSVSIRMLLSHSAGFQGSTWPYDQGLPWEPFEPTEWGQLVAMMPYEQLLFRPGSRYSYSNPGFIYLARIIEQLTGDPWESYVQKNIFAPLGLYHSYFRATPYYLTGDRSHNYYVQKDSAGIVRVVDNGAEFDPGITVPNGGWNAPLSDLARYTAFLTNQPMAPTAPGGYPVVLARKTFDEMWQPGHRMDAETAEREGIDRRMGLSFFVMTRGGKTVIGHTGSQAGFRSFLYFNPGTSAAVISVFNTTNEAAPAEVQEREVERAALDLLW